MTTGTKICSKCNEEKPIGSFWRDVYSKDGIRSACIDCCMLTQNEYARTNEAKEHKQKYNKKRYKRASYKEKQKVYYQQWMKGNRAKGKTCRCGNNAEVMHYFSYRPVVATPMCRKCHAKINSQDYIKHADRT